MKDSTIVRHEAFVCSFDLYEIMLPKVLMEVVNLGSK